MDAEKSAFHHLNKLHFNLFYIMLNCITVLYFNQINAA